MINEHTIRRWWEVFKNKSDLVEIRILGKFQYSGYYKNIDKLIEDIKPYEEMSDEQIYFTLNDIEDGCYGRAQCEKMLKSPKTTTSDNNITHRSWVLIDYDPVRVVGTNATDEEFELAHKKAQQVFSYLRDLGFRDPIICKSGNGWHTIYRCDMPNTDEVRDMLSNFLQSIALMFTDEKVDIDEAVFNASRICKLYGTTAKKGANLPERPWRMSEIVYVPQSVEVNDKSLFEMVANKLPKDEPQPTLPYRGQNGKEFVLEEFLNTHGIAYKRETCAKWTKYVLEHCFFNPEHKHKDAAIIQLQNGAIKYVCLHNTCSNHTWQEMRLALDPSAYDSQPATNYIPQQTYRSYRQQPTPPPIKQETEDIGKKWLSLGDIEDVNLDGLPRIATCFREIDNLLGGGLFMAETTIVSGINGSGKSSWLNTIILNAVDAHVPTALWTGELRAPRLKRWLVQAAAGPNYVEESRMSPGKYFVPKRIIEHIVKWTEGMFFLYNNDYSSNYAQILNDIVERIDAGVKLVILDNLFAMDLDGLEGDENGKQKAFILKLVDIAKKYNIHIILVAHPRKVVTFLRKEDILGSSALQNAVDNIFIIHRTGNDFSRRGKEVFDPKTIDALMGYGNVLEICKNREFGALEKLIGMKYDPKSRRFSDEYSENKKYGWEVDSIPQNINFEQHNQTQAQDGMPFVAPTDEGVPF